MDTASHYWRQVRLRASGQYRINEITSVKDWLMENFAKAISDDTTVNQTLQPALLALYNVQRAEADLAQRSLRCYISHQIQAACAQLAAKFGSDYGFTTRDILPLVLDDEQRASGYCPLSLKILKTYDPRKGKLTTWTTKLVNTHPELNKALLERGLHRATDWGLLNGTAPGQLQRILQDYYTLSDREIAAASHLLSRYRQVYLSDRLAQRRAGQGGRCQPPSQEQLRRMVSAPPEETLAQLKDLASLLREYRTRRRMIDSGTSGTVDWEQISDVHADCSAEEDSQKDFLEAYRQALRQCLGETLASVIQANVIQIRKREQAKAQGKDWAYLQGLQLFYCEDLSMGKIASKIGLSSQVQVTRLLKLGRLRTDVRHQLIPRLCDRLQAEILNFLSADRLEKIDALLEGLLAEDVDRVMDEEQKNAYSPNPRSHSLFSEQLCKAIHQFI